MIQIWSEEDFPWEGQRLDIVLPKHHSGYALMMPDLKLSLLSIFAVLVGSKNLKDFKSGYPNGGLTWGRLVRLSRRDQSPARSEEASPGNEYGRKTSALEG